MKEPPKKHDREILVANLIDVLQVVDQLPCSFFWRAGYRHFWPDLTYKEQAYAGVARACLESTLMSLRTLDEFFRLRGPSTPSTDIRAEDYLGFHDSGNILSKSKRDRINWHIAHFTVERARNPVLLWSYKAEIATAAVKVTKFLDHLIAHFLTSQDDVMPQVKRRRKSLTSFVSEVEAGMDLVVDE